MKNLAPANAHVVRRSAVIASIVVAGAAAAAITLTGCADAASQSATPTSTSSSSAAPRTELPADALPELPKSDTECADGTATITENNLDVTIPGDCATVIVNASNTLVTVGAVQSLTVNGSINKVTATSIESVVFTANGNIVESGTEPKVDDQGAANELNVG